MSDVSKLMRIQYQIADLRKQLLDGIKCHSEEPEKLVGLTIARAIYDGNTATLVFTDGSVLHLVARNSWSDDPDLLVDTPDFDIAIAAGLLPADGLQSLETLQKQLQLCDQQDRERRDYEAALATIQRLKPKFEASS